MIVLIDFGSQTSHLIARRIKDLGIEVEIAEPQQALGIVKEKNPLGIILSGGPSSVYEEGAPTIPKEILTSGIPVLAICYGLQLVVHLLDGEVVSGKKEYGPAELKIVDHSSIKKEISEIKKQFTPENCSLTRICGCYVDGEKNKKTELKEAFLSLSEEEMFKYFEIFRKSLSGTIGKNLMNMEFPLEQETEGGTQHFLMKLRESKLTDDALVESFYDKIIENYDYPENYYIILIHGVYDIPGKSSDGAEMFDASDEIYEHIMCCICPVKLSKAGLCYNAETNSIQDRIRDWIVELPDVAFLFPQFNDRSTDIHGVLYYSKNANELRDIFIDELLGCTAPLSAGGQRDSFNALVEDTLGDDCRYDTVLSIHEKLNDLIESQKDEPEPVVLTKSEVKRLFEECGVEDEKLQSFDEQYEITAGEKSSLVASNITNTKRFEIKTPDVVVHVDPERADLVETRIIDGRKCLVIPMEGEVELNGIRVHTGNENPSDDEFYDNTDTETEETSDGE